MLQHTSRLPVSSVRLKSSHVQSGFILLVEEEEQAKIGGCVRRSLAVFSHAHPVIAISMLLLQISLHLGLSVSLERGAWWFTHNESSQSSSTSNIHSYIYIYIHISDNIFQYIFQFSIQHQYFIPMIRKWQIDLTFKRSL